MMKKRIISLLLAMMMLVGVMSVSAFAAEASTGTLSAALPAEVNVGDTFDVTISVTAEEIAALQLGFVYDAEYLELVKNEDNTYKAVLAEGIPGSAITSSTGSVWTAGFKTEDYSGWLPDELFTNLDGQFMTLTFKALKASEAASITIYAKGGTILEKYITFEDIAVSVKITEATQPEKPVILLGDANLDGKVRPADASVILKYVADILTLDDSQNLAADVNGDGKIRPADASVILKYVADIDTGFAIGEPIEY